MTDTQTGWLMQSRLYSRAEVLANPSPVPKSSGVYAWWFHGLPSVPTSGCMERDGWHLLYVGISPRKPPVAADALPTVQQIEAELSASPPDDEQL